MQLFQFQTGAIKRYRTFANATLRPCFNSKLVRLKVPLPRAARVFHAQFQFQTGAIKSHRFRPRCRGKSLFQFQTGAIKSGACTGRLISVTALFQFQTGAIKRSSLSGSPSRLTAFQFQTGAIKSAGGHPVTMSNMTVSIPNWCD